MWNNIKLEQEREFNINQLVGQIEGWLATQSTPVMVRQLAYYCLENIESTSKEITKKLKESTESALQDIDNTIKMRVVWAKEGLIRDAEYYLSELKSSWK